MDVHAGNGDERMLRRVIALLAAFAVLAERVADRSPWVRCFVLWILRRAETAAADFIFEEAGIAPAALEAIAAAGNGPDNALHLAARFRALAAMLRALLPVESPFGRRTARRGFASGHRVRGFGHHPGDWTPMPFDTS